MKCPKCEEFHLEDISQNQLYCPKCGFFDKVALQDKQRMEMNGMTNNENNQISLVVSLPQGVKEDNFGDSIGRLLPKKGKTGGVIKTKNGEPVLSLALDLTNLKNMIEKHKLKSKDKRSGHEIVWVTGFVSPIKKAGAKNESSSF